MAVLHGVKLMGLDYTFICVQEQKKCLSGIQALPVGARSPVKSGVSFSTGRWPDRPLNVPKGMTLFLPSQLWTSSDNTECDLWELF